jgi:hypothetical protein
MTISVFCEHDVPERNPIYYHNNDICDGEDQGKAQRYNKV